jgi:hypothetical protein
MRICVWRYAGIRVKIAGPLPQHCLFRQARARWNNDVLSPFGGITPRYTFIL